MYWVIDGLCFCSGLAFFIASFLYKFPYLCWVGLLWIAVYPLLLEVLSNLLTCLSSKVEYSLEQQSRIVYSPSYNITFCGIEKMHPFDSEKYGNIYKFLIERQVINATNVTRPDNIPRSLLLEKMSKFYLLKLCYTICICSYVEMPLYFLPAFLLRWRVLDPMMKAAQGSILAVCSAIELGWTVNLSGGFHHASFSNGGGFCIYPDISLAVHYLKTRKNIVKVMIIDLDAHQGNGHERDHIGDENVFIADFYNHYIYPDDQIAMKAIKRDVGVLPQTTDQEYLQSMKILEQDIDSFCPGFVIYNAGTDILQGDRLGELNISAQGIIKRDEIIIEMCVRRKIPVSMFMSGGYQKINAEVIANSIENLLKKFK